MWQRFTERARKAVFYSQEEAQRRGADFVCTEQLLLGLLREENSATKVLGHLGVDIKDVKAKVSALIPPAKKHGARDFTLTPRLKRVIDLSYDHSRSLGHGYIGTEHLLLGLVAEREGIAGQVLTSLGLELETARQSVRDLVTSEGRVPSVPTSPAIKPSAFPIHVFAGLSACTHVRLAPDFCALLLLSSPTEEIAKAVAELGFTPQGLALAIETEMLKGPWRGLPEDLRLVIEGTSTPYSIFQSVVFNPDSFTRRALNEAGLNSNQISAAFTKREA